MIAIQYILYITVYVYSNTNANISVIKPALLLRFPHVCIHLHTRMTATSANGETNCAVVIGQRISVEGSVATVRYVGKLDSDVDNVWVGVEWDDVSRGKHDGSYQGRRYFTCLNGGSGSFLKLHKLDYGVDFVTAVHDRYAPQASAGQCFDLD
jgi:hypothetical protein